MDTLPIRALALLPLLALWACQAADSPQTETGLYAVEPSPLLIITTEALSDAAAEYADYRESTGWAVSVVTTSDLLAAAGDGDLVAAVSARVRLAADEDPGELGPHVLLLGDANEDAPDDPTWIPVATGSLGDLGDGPHGDLDGDDVPDVAIGRLAVNTPEEVEQYLERLRVYESTYTPGPWNRRVHLFTGVGDFGEAIDGILEYVAELVVEELSYDFDFKVTTAIQGSDFYLPDVEWDEEYARQYNEGAVMQPYVGHGLGSVYLSEMEAPQRRGLVAYMSCSDGDFQHAPHPVGSLAEDLMAVEAGPMGVVAASDVSDPYGNAVLIRELSQTMLNGSVATYGQALMQAKYRLLYQEDDLRNAIDTAAALFMDNQEQTLQSHVTLYNLLGDPTVPPRIAARTITLNNEADHLALGQTATISGRVASGAGPFFGTVLLTLEVSRATILHELEPVDAYLPDPETCLTNHALANDKILSSAEGGVADGRFQIALDIPSDVPDDTDFYLKALASDGQQDAIGSLSVVLTR